MQESSKDQTESKVFERDWSAYYNAVVGSPPHSTLLEALAHFEVDESTKGKRFAVDLGCGDGRDSVELLRRGWRVLGIDGNKDAISLLLSRPEINYEYLETQIVRFEDLILPESVDLVNASFSLPFCPPEHFPSLWKKIILCLRFEGRFCGQLFGERDSWAISNLMNHHTREQVEVLLQSFDIEMFEEEYYTEKTILGKEKNWHIFHIVACKR